MTITKSELEKMYRTMTNVDISKKLGISRPTLERMVRDSGIQMKGRGKKSKIIVIMDDE